MFEGSRALVDDQKKRPAKQAGRAEHMYRPLWEGRQVGNLN
jgi:hypothetical protein